MKSRSAKAVMVRNLSEEVHRALKSRAARHGRSTVAEIRDILENAVRPKDNVKIGSALAAFGKKFRLVEFDIQRDRTPIDPATFK